MERTREKKLFERFVEEAIFFFFGPVVVGPVVIFFLPFSPFLCFCWHFVVVSKAPLVVSSQKGPVVIFYFFSSPIFHQKREKRKNTV